MPTDNTASPAGQSPVNAGANNGVNSPTPARVGTADLESALMEASMAAVTPDDASPPPAAGSPELGAETPPPEEAGQTSEPTPPAEGDEPQSGEDQTVLSQTGDAELDAALGQLTPAMRKHVVAVSQLLGDQTLSAGEIPRIGQLLHERHELSTSIEQLTRERDDWKSRAESGQPAEAGSGMPPELAALKTPGEIVARKSSLQNVIRSANNALLKYPQGNQANAAGEPVWKFGSQEFTREELADEITQCQTLLDALPDRLQQLNQETVLASRREQFRAQTRQDFPWLADAQNPRTQAVQKALSGEFAFLKNGVNPEYWAAVIVEGQKALAAERAARNSRNGHAPAPAIPARGKVQPGKPHTASPATPPTPGDAMKRFQAVLPKAGERVTTQKLEDVLAALPPR